MSTTTTTTSSSSELVPSGATQTTRRGTRPFLGFFFAHSTGEMARAILETLQWMKRNPGKVGVVRLNVKAPRQLIFGQEETNPKIYKLHVALYGIKDKTKGPKVWSNRVKFDSATLLEMWGQEVMPFTFLQLLLARNGITMVDVGGTSRDHGFEPKICLSLDPALIQIGTAARFHGFDRKPVDLGAANLDVAIDTFLTEVNKEISPILAELQTLEGRFDLVKPTGIRHPAKPAKPAQAARAVKPAQATKAAKAAKAAKAGEAEEAEILRQEIELRELKLKLARLQKK